MESEFSLAEKSANKALEDRIHSIVDFPSELSEGGLNDFYSTGDYWWPDPKAENGLPYIRRDGESNPDGFYQHRLVLRSMRNDVAALAVAFSRSHNHVYADKACVLLNAFFLDKETRMNPNLEYAQAIPGICSGRGIGIIDTLHLIEVPMAIQSLYQNGGISEQSYELLRAWFGDYLDWMLTSEHGRDERQTGNNHTTAWALQAAVFARFVGNDEVLADLRRSFVEFLNVQMDAQGAFPLELERTRPYNYSLFNLDCFVALAHVLSDERFDLWAVKGDLGQGVNRSIDFHLPFVLDKSSWPYPEDIDHFEDLPGRRAFVYLAAIRNGDITLLRSWESFPVCVDNSEIRRNQIMRQPLLWGELKQGLV